MFNGSGRDGQYSLNCNIFTSLFIFHLMQTKVTALLLTDKGILHRLINDISSYDNGVPVKLTLNNSCCSRDLSLSLISINECVTNEPQRTSAERL